MDKTSDRGDYLSSLAHRIQQTNNARAGTIREVERLDALLAQMQAKFNDLSNRAAPVASLPNEILSTVFEAGCLSLPSPSLSSFEITVSHVTRHWRDVAMNTPSLWTVIAILNRKYVLDMVEAYLARSKSLTLDISIHLATKSPSTDSVMRAIILHIGRWRSFLVVCDPLWWHFSIMVKSLHSCCAPRLESVEIVSYEFGWGVDVEDASVYDGGDAGEEDGSNACEIFTGGATLLKTVRMKGICLFDCLPAPSMVTSLHIHGATEEPLAYTKFCVIFRSLPALTHLFLYDYRVELPGGSASSVVFPSLSSLRILSSGRGRLDPMLLAIISAPQLRHLFVDEFCNDAMEFLVRYPGWSTTSPRYPLLSSLTLDLLEHIVPYTWRLIEQSFATVANLTVFVAFGGQQFIVSSIMDVRFPSLHTLSLGGLQFPNDVGLLSVALSARLEMGRPLQKLCLIGDGYMNLSHAIEQLQQYAEVEESRLKRWDPGPAMWYDESS
jgi:hypothetical protein